MLYAAIAEVILQKYKSAPPCGVNCAREEAQRILAQYKTLVKIIPCYITAPKIT